MHKLLCTLLAVLGTGVLAAANPGPGQWQLSGDFVYLMPTLDDTYFVIDSPTASAFPSGIRKDNAPDFHPGFRVGLTYGFCDCCRTLRLDYTYLGFKQTDTVTGTNLWATKGRPDMISQFQDYSGEAASRLQYLYQRVNATMAQPVMDCCGLNVSLRYGLEYAFLRLNEEYAYVSATTIGLGREKSHTWGVGPQIGFDLEYELCKYSDCCPGTLSINFCSSASLLTGQTENSIFNSTATTTTTTQLDVNSRNTWRIIPALHANIGLNYDMCICGYQGALEVGYEFNSYLRGLSRVNFPDDSADSLCANSYCNFDVQGLYVSARVSF